MTSRTAAPGVSTSWEDQPLVSVTTRAGGAARFVIELVTTPGDGSTAPRWSRITFHDVYVYRFVDVDLGYEPDNPDDYEFGLIEVTDSALREDVFARGRWQNEGPERDLRVLFGPEGLRHYRIGFDDHGTYDVLCSGASVELDVR
jgi:hypothetical protein